MPHHKESIFTTIVKKLAGSFFSVIGFFLALFLFFGAIGLSVKGSTSKIGEILPMKVYKGSTGYTETLSTSSPAILQININGPIGMPKCSPMRTFAMVQKVLRQPTFYNIDTKNIKGLFLHINSPGGAVSDSDEIYTEIKAFKKKHGIPVHVWVKDICFSGGLYIACAGDYISAQRISMIGSVGVRLSNPNFNFYKLMEKLGISATVITAGKDKIPFPKFTPKQPGTESYQDVINITEVMYKRFLEVVVGARGPHGLTEEKLREVGGSIYMSTDAQKMGYIDKAEVRYDEALDYFAETLGIKDQNYQVVSFENPMNFMQNLQAKMESKFSAFFGDDGASPISLQADYSQAL